MLPLPALDFDGVTIRYTNRTIKEITVIREPYFASNLCKKKISKFVRDKNRNIDLPMSSNSNDTFFPQNREEENKIIGSKTISKVKKERNLASVAGPP